MADFKYNLLKHPNIRNTEDGGAAPYDYTAADNSLDDLPGAPENYELLDMDDFLPAFVAGDPLVVVESLSMFIFSLIRAMGLILLGWGIVQGMVSTIITQSGSSGMSSVTLPQELVDAINDVGFWDSIPLWAVTLIGGLLITVLSFTMILTVYGRMFSLWMYAAIAPIPLSTFAGEPTSSVGKNFIGSYAGVCLQGVVIALSCIIFYAISSSPPAVDIGASVVTVVWTYVGELAFNLLVLVGAIKGCDRIVKEIMGL
mgnify:CR=1 FL=1